MARTIPGVGRITGLISLLLYLCSDDPEIGTSARPGAVRDAHAPPRPSGTGGSSKPRPVTVWDVGTDIGPQLDTGATGYWSGTTEGDRYRYRWITTTCGGV